MPLSVFPVLTTNILNKSTMKASHDMLNVLRPFKFLEEVVSSIYVCVSNVNNNCLLAL